MSDAKGYEELAAHMAELGKVRRVYGGTNGGLAVVDGDGGSSPARLGMTAAAHGFYGGDMEHGYYAVAQAGSGPEQCPACHGAAAKCLCTGDEVEQALWLELEHLRAQLACECSERVALADRVAALELKGVAA